MDYDSDFREISARDRVPRKVTDWPAIWPKCNYAESVICSHKHCQRALERQQLLGRAGDLISNLSVKSLLIRTMAHPAIKSTFRLCERLLGDFAILS